MIDVLSWQSLVTIVLSIIPGLIWLNFYLKEDKKPEPLGWLVLVFIFGAAMTIPSSILEKYLDQFFRFGSFKDAPLIGGGNFWSILIFLFLAAFIEELVKFLAVYFSVFRSKKIFNEPVDAMIYMVVAAIGFSTLENLIYSATTLSKGLFHLIPAVVFIRFVGATFMHTLSSALIGYGLGWKTFYGHKEKFIFGITAAVLLHTLYNFLIILNAWLFAFIAFGLFMVGLRVLHEFDILKVRSGQYGEKIIKN